MGRLDDMILEAVKKQISLRGNSDEWACQIPKECPPIVWFGDVERYLRQSPNDRLVSIGVNPSPGEYYRSISKNQLLRVPRLYVPEMHLDESISDSQLDAMCQEMYKAQNAYFHPPVKSKGNRKGSPLTKWFGRRGNGRIEGFLNGLGWSYYDCSEYASAIHIDMFPFVTRDVYTKIKAVTKKDLFESNWAPRFLSKLLDVLHPRYILTFGKTNICALQSNFSIELPDINSLDDWDRLDSHDERSRSKYIAWKERYVIVVVDYLPGPRGEQRDRVLVFPWGQSARRMYITI